MSRPLAERPLFGGAITMQIPGSYEDASDLRQIPDNQEVFLSHDSDTSLVVEILALVDQGPAANDLWQAVQYHFSSIAQDNASLSTEILTPPPPTPSESPIQPLASAQTPTPTILTGLQTIHKYSHDPTGAPRPGHETDPADKVWIGLALWRIDLADSASLRRKRADVVCSVNVNLSAADGKGQAERHVVEEWWKTAVASFAIRDFALFGDEA